MEKKKNKSDKKDQKQIYMSKPERSYIKPATKVAIHPIRSQILKVLKEGDKSTVELESITGEARYNLYHHLNALEREDFISWKMRDNKTKLYQLKNPKKPESDVIVLDEHDIEGNQEKFSIIMSALAEIRGEKIPDVNKIKDAEICLYYSRKKGK